MYYLYGIGEPHIGAHIIAHIGPNKLHDAKHAAHDIGPALAVDNNTTTSKNKSANIEVIDIVVEKKDSSYRR